MLNTWVTLASCCHCQYCDTCLSHVPVTGPVRGCLCEEHQEWVELWVLGSHRGSLSQYPCIASRRYSSSHLSAALTMICVLCFSKFCCFDACESEFDLYLYLYFSDCYGVLTSFHRLVYLWGVFCESLFIALLISPTFALHITFWIFSCTFHEHYLWYCSIYHILFNHCSAVRTWSGFQFLLWWASLHRNACLHV